MSTAVFKSSKYVDEKFYDNPTGGRNISFSGTVESSPSFLGNYLTKEELENGALDDLYVTLSTDQSIDGEKYFVADTSFGDNIQVKNALYSTDAVISNDLTAYNEGHVYGTFVGHDTVQATGYFYAQDQSYFTKDLVDSAGFVSGFAGSGWRIKKDAETGIGATFDNLTIRNTMRVYELLVEQIRCNNGALWVSNGAKITNVNKGDTFWYLYWDEDLYAGCPFAENDIIRAQTFDGRNILSTQGIVYYIAATYFIMTRESIIGDDPSANQEFVRIGNTTNEDRQGAIYLTASDDDAPYIEVIDDVDENIAAPFVGKNRLRLGKLDGIVDINAGLDGTQENLYGLYSDSVYLRGFIRAESGLIGGWDISTYQIKTTYGASELTIKSERVTSGVYGMGYSYYGYEVASGELNNIQIGQIYTRYGTKQTYDSFTGTTNLGIQVTSYFNSSYNDILFRISDVGDAQISGWFFDEDYLWSGTKQTSDAFTADGITLGNDAIRTPNFRIDSNGNLAFRSSASGKKIEIDSVNNAMKFYGTNGNLQIEIDDTVGGSSNHPGIKITDPNDSNDWSQMNSGHISINRNSTEIFGVTVSSNTTTFEINDETAHVYIPNLNQRIPSNVKAILMDMDTGEIVVST